MKKVFFQGTVVILLFFSIWFGLKQINWINVLKIDYIKENTEQKLAEVFKEVFELSETAVECTSIVNPVDSLLTQICAANNIKRESINIYIVESEEVNAFAFPGRNIVLYTGLIAASDNQDVLSGVISHELAHIELNHVMKKLIKEVGLATLFSIAAGEAGMIILSETAKTITSTAYDRSLEKEADLKAVDFMLNAQINPEPFAEFLFMLGQGMPDYMHKFTWISTHPNPEVRAGYIFSHLNEVNTKTTYEAILTEQTWNSVLKNLEACVD